MEFTGIKESCIYVTDLKAAKEFYNGTLGLPLISIVDGRHAFFRAGSSVLLCFIAESTQQETELPPHGAHGVIHFAFEVKRMNYEQTLQALQDKGISILHKQKWKNGLRSFYFHDPDSNLIEVIEEGLWEK